MGTFAEYTGKMKIPQEKKNEFTQNILKLLNYGGMMQFDKVNLYGKEIALLKPVEIDASGRALFHFNYFEDDAWETAGYDSNDACFFSNKIGWKEFNNVIIAVYFLYELYDEEPGFPMENGDIMADESYVGWINDVLKTNFSMKKRFRLWENYEKYCLYFLGEADWKEAPEYDVVNTVPRYLYRALGGTELADICYVINGTESLDREKPVPGSYPEVVYQCRELLKRHFADSKDDESIQLQEIWDMVKRPKNERGESAISRMSQKLPARVLVYLACELKHVEFWDVWKDLYKEAYRDEEMPQYASDKLLLKRKKMREEPIAALPTKIFLRQSGGFTFYGTPEELKGKPNYYLSDDDRAFWWDGSKEVVFSKEMEQWIQDLAYRHQELTENTETGSWNRDNFLEKMLCILEEIERCYKRVYCFQSMFYEFLQNSMDRRYIAAVRLLEELAKEHEKEGKIMERQPDRSWDIMSKNVTHNAGRLVMKRYLSVLANEKLREKYFGF